MTPYLPPNYFPFSVPLIGELTQALTGKGIQGERRWLQAARPQCRAWRARMKLSSVCGYPKPQNHTGGHQARTGGGIQGIHGYPSLETPIHPVGNLQDLVGILSDILMKEKEGQKN
jgi:hypothetical protein